MRRSWRSESITCCGRFSPNKPEMPWQLAGRVASVTPTAGGAFIDFASPIQDMQTGRGDCAALLLSAIPVNEQRLALAIHEIRRPKLAQFRREALCDHKPVGNCGRFMSPRERKPIHERAENDFRIPLSDRAKAYEGLRGRGIDRHSVSPPHQGRASTRAPSQSWLDLLRHDNRSVLTAAS